MVEQAASRAETAKRRAERLDGLGERVAAVAHELKVPLSLIVGSLESLDSYVASLVERIEQLEADAARLGRAAPAAEGRVFTNAAALVRICREGADRLEHVVQEITAYARGGAAPPPAARVDVARALRTAVDLMARSMPNAPPVRLEVAELPPVRADEDAFTRIVVNLVRNAFDALAGHAAPLVRITAHLGRDLDPPMVEIRIADNGPGIRAEDRSRVFEPFFSGKAHGVGLGLGLAIAKDLAEAQHGTIELAPASAVLPVASGTAFVIRLPVAT